MKYTIDFETRSEADIRTVGAWAYAEHPTTDILCLAVNDGKSTVVYKPEDIKNNKLKFDGAEVEAHNAFFEQAIWHNIMHKRYGHPDIPIHRWRCSAAKAAAHALPRSLERAGMALNLPVQKSMDGRRVMMKLSRPRRPSINNPDTFWTKDKAPDDFKTLYEYCQTDVEAEEAISNSLRDLTPKEQQVWFLDQKINRRGILVDEAAIDNALGMIDQIKKGYNQQIKELTGYTVKAASNTAAITKWLNDNGVETEDVTKQTVSELLANDDLPDYVKSVLKIRQSAGKTSTAKFTAMKKAMCSDGRIRDYLMYHGASTGRWAGKLVQFQNIPRGSIDNVDRAIELIEANDLSTLTKEFGDPMEAISSCIRGMIVAPEGKEFLIADYASIETRVLFWLAGESRGVQQFFDGADLYVDMAKAIFNSKEISKDQRQLGKVAILGCGYGMGAAKFYTTCNSWGVTVSEELAQRTVDIYRTVYSSVKQYWYAQERAAIDAVASGKHTTCGNIIWGTDDKFLYCRLPSGRRLAYPYPKLEDTVTPWGANKKALTFMGTNSVTRKWERQSTYGGKLVENITQAVARDIMAEAMVRCETEGYEIVLSVHDELIAEMPEGLGSLDRFIQLMCKLPEWAKGCPVQAEGFKSKRYKK